MPAHRNANTSNQTAKHTARRGARTRTARQAAKTATARRSDRISAEDLPDQVQAGLNAASEGAQRLTDQTTQIFGLSGERGEDLTRQSARNLEAMTQAGTVLARGFQDLSRECSRLMQERVQTNMDAFGSLVRCRSLPDVMAVQNELLRDGLEQVLDGTRRIADVSSRVVREATETMTTRPARRRMA
jgi:phasin family protein